MAVIKLENGATIRTFPPPPEGFDPLTAPAAELALHGFPARPEDPALLERYGRHFGRVKGRFRYVVPAFTVRPSMRNRSAGTPEGVAGQTIWSGAVVYAASGQSFKWVQAEWIIPDAAIPAAGANSADYACVSWIGLGNSSLLQAGAGCGFGTNGTANFFLWHEWTPPGWVTINNLAAGP